MCRLVVQAARAGGAYVSHLNDDCSLRCPLSLDQQVISDARRVAGEPEGTDYIPADAREFANRIFHTCYMGTENSSPETRKRAKDLAKAIGRCARMHVLFICDVTYQLCTCSYSFFSYHIDLNMDTLVTAIRELFAFVTGVKPRFRVHGGTGAENLALQNIQARLRMVIAYLFAQLMPWVRGRQGGLLVLGSANVDERSVRLTHTYATEHFS